MEKKYCPVCGYEFPVEYDNFIPYPSKVKNHNIPERIIFCGNCTLGISDPLLSDAMLKDYYKDSKYWKESNPEISIRKQPVLHAMAKARWSLIESFLSEYGIKEVSLLDIGAGYGYLGIVAAQSKNVFIEKYTAVEPDQNISKALSSAWPRFGSGCKLEINSTLNGVNGKYKIVALSHVLEHVNDPLDLLNKAKSFTDNNGLIFIDVPNMDYNFKEDVFPHVLFFTEKSVSELLHRASLEIIHLAAYGISSGKSPLNSRASFITKCSGKLLGRISGLLTGRISGKLFSYHFGINRHNPSGTWIRAIGK